MNRRARGIRISQWLPALLAAVILLSGCAGSAPRAFPESAPAAELSGVPFYPQEENHCGPAALATVLGAHDAAVAPDELADWLYLPAREGSLQVEMVAEVRQQGLPGWAVTDEPERVMHEIRAGRPVLVLKNLGLSWWPLWHYAVVIGYRPEDDVVLLRSGTEPERELSQSRFMRFWGRSDYWALVIAPPGDVPAALDAPEYLQGVANLESVAGADSDLEDAWLAGIRRWPNDSAFWLAYANHQLAREQPEEAESILQAGLQHAQEHGALHHNLAWLLAEQGRRKEALVQAQAAVVAGGEFLERSLALLESLE